MSTLARSPRQLPDPFARFYVYLICIDEDMPQGRKYVTRRVLLWSRLRFPEITGYVRSGRTKQTSLAIISHDFISVFHKIKFEISPIFEFGHFSKQKNIN